MSPGRGVCWQWRTNYHDCGFEQGIVAVGEPVSINSSGTVAFLASEASDIEGIFTGNGGPITTLYDNSTGSPFFTFGSPAINDHGIVAFAAWNKNTGGLAGIFAGTGAPTSRGSR
jgi:hypothetical protein